MPGWMPFVKLLHVLAAILFVGGLFARNVAFAAARRSAGRETAGRETAALAVTGALLHLSERFDRLMVRPGSELVFLFGLLTAWLQHLPVLGVLTGASPRWVFVSLMLYLLTIPLVVLVLIPGTRRRGRAAEAAAAEGRVTAELQAALADRSVLLTRNAELAIILVVIALMVLKPF